MQRQGNTADIRFNLAIQKALDPTDDPIEDVAGEAFESGEKAGGDWGEDERSESGSKGDSAEDLLRMAKKAEELSSAVAKWGKPKGSAPQKAPAASTGFSLPAKPKPAVPKTAPSLGFSNWPSRAPSGSETGLNRAELAKALDNVEALARGAVL